MFDPWVGKISWRRRRQPTPILLPGEFHRQRSLAGYSPWGRKEADRTERLSTLHLQLYKIVALLPVVHSMSLQLISSLIVYTSYTPPLSALPPALPPL